MWNAFVEMFVSWLVFLNNLLEGIGAPYSYGLAIILFTLMIKLITLPLTLQQIRSSKAAQELQPELQKLQKRYGKDKEKLAQKQMELYRKAGVNPFGGCLTMLVQLPIWIGLYQALYRIAQEKLLTGGFLWIKDLAFPTPKVGMSWIWNPQAVGLQWTGVISYLILPVLTVVTQVVAQKMTTPPNPDPEQAAMNQAMLLMLPLMLGFFAMQVPSGLTLYWVTSNIITIIQQYFTLPRARVPQKG